MVVLSKRSTFRVLAADTCVLPFVLFFYTGLVCLAGVEYGRAV